MKKIFSLLFIFSLALFISGCSDDDKVFEDIVMQNTVSTSPVASEGYIELITSNFTATASDSWCNIRVEGNKIFVSLENNTGRSNRSAIINIKHGYNEVIIPITQLGLLFEIQEGVQPLIYSLRGGEKSFNIITNVDVKIVPSHDWITYQRKDKTVTFSVPDSEDARYGEIKFEYAGTELVLPVEQVVVLTYEELLGSAKLKFKDQNDIAHNIDVTISPLETQKTVRVKGTFPTVNEVEFTMSYDVAERRLIIQAAQFLKILIASTPEGTSGEFLSLDLYSKDGSLDVFGEPTGKPLYTQQSKAWYGAESEFHDTQVNFVFHDTKSWYIKPIFAPKEMLIFTDGISMNGRTSFNGSETIGSNWKKNYLLLFNLELEKDIN